MIDVIFVRHVGTSGFEYLFNIPAAPSQLKIHTTRQEQYVAIFIGQKSVCLLKW